MLHFFRLDVGFQGVALQILDMRHLQSVPAASLVSWGLTSSSSGYTPQMMSQCAVFGSFGVSDDSDVPGQKRIWVACSGA